MTTTDCEARFAIHASIDAAAAHVLRMGVLRQPTADLEAGQLGRQASDSM